MQAAIGGTARCAAAGLLLEFQGIRAPPRITSRKARKHDRGRIPHPFAALSSRRTLPLPPIRHKGRPQAWWFALVRLRLALVVSTWGHNKQCRHISMLGRIMWICWRCRRIGFSGLRACSTFCTSELRDVQRCSASSGCSWIGAYHSSRLQFGIMAFLLFAMFELPRHFD